MENSPILIIGKNGKTDRRAKKRLQTLLYPTRAVSRSTSPSFDWEQPETWQPAMEGTVSAYVTYQPDLAIPAAEAAIREFIYLARETGLQYIVLLSGRGEDGARRAEKLLQNSGLSWNIVRCSWFCQNFSESFMLEGILADELVLPAGDTAEPFVDAYIEALHEQGVPDATQWLLHELFTVVFDGRNSQVMSGVEEALGRPATDFTTYVQKTVASGVWDTPQHKENT